MQKENQKSKVKSPAVAPAPGAGSGAQGAEATGWPRRQTSKVTQIFRPLRAFWLITCSSLLVTVLDAQTRNQDQVLNGVLDTTNTALRMNVVANGGGGGQGATFFNADQMFNKIYDSTNNALRINTVIGGTYFIDVKTYGAKGDGVTDDTTAITNAINACPASGCTVLFPPGSYYTASGITTSKPNLVLRGTGRPGWGGLNPGTSELITNQAVVVLTFGTGAGSTIAGPGIYDLGFRDTSGAGTALGGISLKRTAHFRLDNINCGDFTNGYCISMDGTGDFTQIGLILNPLARNVKFGIQGVANVSDVVIVGGELTPSVAAGNIGIDIETNSSTVMVYGTSIETFATGIKIFDNQADILKPRLEQTGGTGTGILVDGTGVTTCTGNKITDGSINSFATGINVTANCNQTTIANNTFRGTTTNITDAGKETAIQTTDQMLIQPAPTGTNNRGGFISKTRPGQGSQTFPTIYASTGFGMLLMDNPASTQAGLWLESDNASRGCLGAGVFGSCASSGGTIADTTSAAEIRFNDTAGATEFFGNTGLTSGSGFTPTKIVTVDTGGFTFASLGMHLKNSAAASDLAGTIALSAATSASKTFTTAFTSAPVCTLTPTSNLGATSWWVTTSTTAVTANVSASSTVTFNYLCIGNPN